MNKKDNSKKNLLKALKDERGAGMFEDVMLILFVAVALTFALIALDRALFRDGHEAITAAEGKVNLVGKQAEGYREDSADDIGVVEKFFKWVFEK